MFVYVQDDQCFLRFVGPPPLFSPEVQAVLDRMGNLDQVEIDAIETFVDGQVAFGNWDLLDEFYCFSLNQADSLTGFRAFTAVQDGALNHSVQQGYVSPSTNAFIGFIDTRLDLGTLTNFQFKDCLAGLFITQIPTSVQNWDMLREETSAPNTTFGLRYRGTDTTDWRSRANSQNNINVTTDLVINNLISLADIAGVGTMFFDDVADPSTTISNNAVPIGENVFVMGGNTNGAVSNARDGGISIAYFGAFTGFNLTGFVGGVRTLLTNLGVTGV